jgi:hypothetical protein
MHSSGKTDGFAGDFGLAKDEVSGNNIALNWVESPVGREIKQ